MSQVTNSIRSTSDAPARHTPPKLLLASTSRYRRELLQRLQWPFEAVAPHTDESPWPAEAPAALAGRLALAKAHAVAALNPQAVVIGSDQVADLDGRAIGKPGNHARATEQLQQLSGRSVVFYTAVAVVCNHSGFEQTELASVRVRFRMLSALEIEQYLQLEQPYDCAGSAKSESLGITLLERIDNDDPSALVGLPLIRTCQMLRNAGIDLLGPRPQALSSEAQA